MDKVSVEARSKNMRAIRSKNTKPEIIVRKLLHKMGYRFRLHNNKLPGKPDVCLKKYNSIILVHGCFWHHHKKCIDGKIPKSNVGFWKSKIERNIARDKENKKALREMGWNVITIWECEINDTVGLEKRIKAEMGKR